MDTTHSSYSFYLIQDMSTAFITYIPVYHMFMLLLPTEFISIVLEVLNLYAYRRSRSREMLKNSTHR